MKRVIFAALALVAMASCTKTDPEMDLALDGEVRITSSISTRVSGDAWDENDQIGVYMNLADGTVGALRANVPHITTAGDGKFTTSTTDPVTTPLYYPQSGDVDLLAYYPYDKDLTAATAYKVDVSDQGDLSLIDLMTAKAEDKSKSTTAIDLTFAHKLANVIITIEAGNGFEAADLTGVTATISGTKATATYDLTKGDAETPIAFANETVASKISIPVKSLVAEAIVIPQALSGVTLDFELTNGDTYSAKVKSSDFLAGNKYQYTAKINKTSVTLSAANITPWGAGNGATGDELTAEKVVPDMAYNDGVFEIYTAEGLKAFADLTNRELNTTANVKWGEGSIQGFSDSNRRLDIDGKLMENINLSTICGEGIGESDADVDWTPIAKISSTYDSYQYGGTFDGNGKVVSGLYINSESSYQALFGGAVNATIKNLFVEGSVTGAEYVAGIVTNADGSSLIGCGSKVKVTSKDSSSNAGAAGVVCKTYNSMLIACYNQGEVNADSQYYVGGVAAYVSDGCKFISCYNSAKVFAGGTVYTSYCNSFSGYASASDNAIYSECYWVDYDDDNVEQGDRYEKTTECDDIAALNSHLNDLNDGIELWNYMNPNSMVAVKYTAAAVASDPLVVTVADPVVPIYSGITFNNDCYEITSGEGLATFAEFVKCGYNSINGKVMNEFSLNTVCGASLNGGNGINWTPIGTKESKYLGEFDGANCEISDLYINDDATSHQALFDYIDNPAKIKNVIISSGSVSGKSYVAGIVAYMSGSLNNSIENCTNKASITGAGYYIGGVVGYAKGAITKCTNEGSILSNNTTSDDILVGGIVGKLIEDGILSGCKNKGAVKGSKNYVGGIVGSSEGKIEYCTNESAVEGKTKVGGIAGYLSYASIVECANSGAVTGTVASGYDIGGVVGSFNAPGYTNLTAIACSNSATVSVTASDYRNVGGVVGSVDLANYGRGIHIVACYNSGEVQNKYDDNIEYMAGVVGRVVGSATFANIVACYNVGEVSSYKVGDTSEIGGIAGYAGNSSFFDNYWISEANTQGQGAIPTNGIAVTNNCSDTEATKVDNIAALNDKVGDMNNAIALRCSDCDYEYEAGIGGAAPTLKKLTY